MPASPLWQGGDATNPTKFDTAANWNPGSVPVSGDSGYFRNTAANVFTGLSQSAVALAYLEIASTFTGKIGGTSDTANVPGAGYLAIGAAITDIGAASTSGTAGNGSQRLKLDYGGTLNVTTIRNTSKVSKDTGFAPVRLKGTNAANKLYVQAGRVDCGVETPVDVYKCTEFNVTGSATLSLGPTSVWVTGYQTAGNVNLNSGGATFRQTAGTMIVNGSSVIRSVTIGGVATINARPTAATITSITRSSTTATVTMSAAHPYAAGDTVLIRGAGQAGYNGFKTILTASTPTFTFACAADDVTPATGTMTALLSFPSIYITKTGTCHFKDDPREIAVATLLYEPGAKWTFNPTNPNLIVGTLSPQNAGRLTAAAA